MHNFTKPNGANKIMNNNHLKSVHLPHFITNEASIDETLAATIAQQDSDTMMRIVRELCYGLVIGAAIGLILYYV